MEAKEPVSEPLKSVGNLPNVMLTLRSLTGGEGRYLFT